VARRARANVKKRRKEAEDDKQRTRSLSSRTARTAPRLNTLSKGSQEYELAIQDIIADIERLALITDEDRARMAYTFGQAVDFETVVVCGTCGRSDPDLKHESVLSTTCRRGPRPTTSSRTSIHTRASSCSRCTPTARTSPWPCTGATCTTCANGRHRGQPRLQYRLLSGVTVTC
jgi:hypothetical protein